MGMLGARVVLMAITCSLAAGCVSDSVPAEDVPAEDGLVLIEGWESSTDDARFAYRNGTFHASFAGDQVMVTVKSEGPIDLGRFQWRLEGKTGPEVDDLPTRIAAFWENSQAEPEWMGVWQFLSDFVGVNVGGTALVVEDPQELVFPPGGTYAFTYEFADPIVLPPGEWRFWFAMPYSVEMKVEFSLPALRLAELPRTGLGCGVLGPEDLEAEGMLYVYPAARVVERAEWSVDVPPDRSLLGLYLAASSPVQQVHYRLNIPGSETWEYRSSTLEHEAFPPDWGGLVLTSSATGGHVYEVLREVRGPLATPPGLAYCVL